VVQQVAQAWAQLKATQGAVAIQSRQVDVERVAVEGNQVEERVGLRTTIELLNAELELANSRVELLQSRRDQYVAQAALLAAMGLLEVRYLVPDAKTYDPGEAFRRVDGRGAPPWTGVIGTIDHLGAPSTPPPRLSPAHAGSERPTAESDAP
jgi:outer membrane protein